MISNPMMMTHPFAAVRVREILKWCKTGQYEEMEATCTPEQTDILRRLMAEVCVLVSVNSVAI